MILIYTILHRGATVITALTLALLPFILILTYESIVNESWPVRRHCKITVISMLAVITAFWL